ncbi:MAG: Tfp pilus assembly protein FimT/FimU, partial [Alphaproteobacteria bacterium]
HTQSGRSMVEMLGVLAIIGVLSVAGIVGFKNAMDKNLANTIINEAVINHIQLYASLNKSNTNWQDVQNTLYPMQSKYDKNENDYIRIKDIPEKLCQQLLNMKTNEILFYTAENEKMTTCSENNNMVIGFKPEAILFNSDSSDVGNCENGNVYLSYRTNPCDTVQEMTGDCKKNSDCEKGKYCQFSGKWTGSDSIITKGECTPLDDGNTVSYNGKDFLIKQSDLTWWAAQNWCKTHKKRLIFTSDLGCTLGTDCPQTNDFGTKQYWRGENNPNSPYQALIVFSPQGGSAYNRSGLYGVICK